MTFTLSRKTLLVLGFVLVFGAGVGLGAILSDGGGNESTTTVVASPEEPIEEEAETTPANENSEEAGDSSLTNCEEAGISAEPRQEGTCEEEGVKYVVVNESSKLRLKELEVELLGIKKAKTASSEYGETKTANGTYVIFTLEVTNKTRVPAYFDSSQEQAFLYINGNTYTEDFEVENYALDDAFLEVEEIQPQGSEVGTIAFDVPNSVLPGLTESGNLDIINFSDESLSAAREVGTIRTYQ